MIKLAKGVEMLEVDGTTVLLKNNGDAAVLNAQAVNILSALIDGKTKPLVVEQVLKSYEVSRAQATEDIDAFVNKLLKNELAISG